MLDGGRTGLAGKPKDIRIVMVWGGGGGGEHMQQYMCAF